MNCPKCDNEMEPVEFGTDINVHRCQGCHGLFCNSATLQMMRDQWLADTVLDTGSAVEGAQHNLVEDIPCPNCKTIMHRVEDMEQVHVVLDMCPSCDGVFLDAGELTDLKNVTLMDHIRRLLSKL